MLDIFRGLKNLIKISHVKTDSLVFRLHYSITVMMLMSFSLIVTTRQYVGNPIDCVHTKDLPEDVLNTYCWIHSTYTLKSLFRKRIGVEVPYPGIGNSGNSEHIPNDRKFYRYYQWVCVKRWPASRFGRPLPPISVAMQRHLCVTQHFNGLNRFLFAGVLLSVFPGSYIMVRIRSECLTSESRSTQRDAHNRVNAYIY